MEDIRFNSENEFQNCLKSATKFKLKRQGKQGIVYLRDGLVIKDLGINPSLDYDHVMQFRYEQIEDVYFPISAIHVQKSFRGCITKYAPGKSLDEQKLFDVDVHSLWSAIEKLENIIKIVSEKNIRMNDLNLGNIVYYNGTFSIIDTLNYYNSPLAINDLKLLNFPTVFAPIMFSILPLDIYKYFLNMGYFSRQNLQEPKKVLERIVATLEDMIINPFDSFQEAANIIQEDRIFPFVLS